MSILTCINAIGQCIPSFYIFRGKRFLRNYIKNCTDGAAMAMQPKVWMTGFLFYCWIDHFLKHIGEKWGISQKNRHLLVLDGHNSHVTVEVVQKAKATGLDLVILPSHTSHALQPLDVSVYKLFKTAFRLIRDRNILRKPRQRVTKEELAGWVAQVLKKAMQPQNITSGFRAIGIWPLNEKAVENKLGPSEAFASAEVVEERCTDDESGAKGDLGERVGAAEEAINENRSHYYVHVAEEDQSVEDSERVISLDTEYSIGKGDLEQATEENIGDFLALPHVPPQRKRRSMQQPLIDYGVSIILTSKA
jgi:hypothetical protein